jgi:hypothetical protein
VFKIEIVCEFVRLFLIVCVCVCMCVYVCVCVCDGVFVCRWDVAL